MPKSHSRNLPLLIAVGLCVCTLHPEKESGPPWGPSLQSRSLRGEGPGHALTPPGERGRSCGGAGSTVVRNPDSVYMPACCRLARQSSGQGTLLCIRVLPCEIGIGQSFLAERLKEMYR